MMKALGVTLIVVGVLFGLAAIVMIFASLWAGSWGVGGALFFSGVFAALLSVGGIALGGFIVSEVVE